MLISKSYKTRLRPNNVQVKYFQECVDGARVAYNWGLRYWVDSYNEQKEAGVEKPKVGWQGAKKAFNVIKYQHFPFLVNVPGIVTESAFVNLGQGFKRYFDNLRNGEVSKKVAELKKANKWKKFCAKRLKMELPCQPMYPTFKHRWDADSFQISLRDRVFDSHIIIPLPRKLEWRVSKRVPLIEHGYLPTTEKLAHYVTISQRANDWFVSVTGTEVEFGQSVLNNTVIGIDFGLKELAYCSNGKVFPNPHLFKSNLTRMRRLQRKKSKQWRMNHNDPEWRAKVKTGKGNYVKTLALIKNLHKRIVDQKRHLQHEVSSYVTYDVNPIVIAIENLNIGGMLKNPRLSLSIADVGWYEIRRQIEYKAQWIGTKVVVADAWEPSSKKCSSCGNIKANLSLADRMYTCVECGLVIDRDYNAALNLRKLGLDIL